MKCIILHETDKRIRLKAPLINMSMRDADLLECYLKNIPEVREASVDERTGNAIVTFRRRSVSNRRCLFDALSVYDKGDEAVAALVPEETGRKLNREYQEKFLNQVVKHYACKLLLPAPVAAARTVIKSIPFIFRTIRSLFSGKLQVEALDGIAITAAILRNDFSTASSIMFLLESGEILEEWTRKKSIGDLARSMSLNVDKVWLIDGDCEVQVGINKINVGDRIIVRSSDIIPLDGKVVRGDMTVNQSAMTGESEPVFKTEGGYVYAGTVVEEGECVIEVTCATGSGKYDQIIHMIEESEKLKSGTEAKAYRLADKLVPYSLGGFALTYIFTGNVTKALAFLMVDYSCALKLSMPLSVLSAIRESREYGIFVKGGKFIEAVAEADTIIFDKTGTLTHAAPKLVEVIPFSDNDPDEMLRVAACLEEHYPHSVANAIVNGAIEKGLRHDELHSKVEYIVAHGVSSYIEDKKAVIGSYHFVIEDEGCRIPDGEWIKLEQVREEYSKIFLAIDGILSAVLCIYDPVRQEAGEVLHELRTLGITKICMMTGDNYTTAKAVAGMLKLDEFRAEVLPEEKAAFIKTEKGKGRKVIMVGDGINDSPALSEADVGVAIESGAAIAREISDITITSESLYQLVMMRKLSTALMQRINANYRFIIGFNSALIAMGLIGILPPSSSALLHNSSTIMTGLKSMTNLIDP